MKYIGIDQSSKDWLHTKMWKELGRVVVLITAPLFGGFLIAAGINCLLNH